MRSSSHFKPANLIHVIQDLMLLIIRMQTLSKLNLAYCDLLFDCNATSFSHALSGKHGSFALSSA